MLIILFSLKLGWLPSSGMRTTGVHTLWDLTKHAIMPVVVLSIGKISILCPLCARRDHPADV